MSTKISVASVFVINILNAIAVAVSFIHVANLLGPEQFGEFVLAFTIASFPPLFAGLGTEQILLMYGSRDLKQLRILIGPALMVRTSLSLAIIGIVALAGLLLEYDHFELVFLAIGGGLLNGYYTSVFSTIFRIFRKHWLAVIFTFLGNVLFLVLVLTADKNRVDAFSVMQLLVVSYLFTFLVSLLVVSMHVRLHFQLRSWKRHLKQGLQFSGSQGIDLLFQRVDVFLLQILAGSFAVGVYSAATRIVAALILFPSAMHYVYLPEFHQSAADKIQLENAFSRFFKLILHISGLVIGGIFFTADAVINLLYKDSFGNSALVMQILAVSYFFTFITYPYSMYAEAMKQLGERLNYRIVSLVVVVFFAVILIPLFGEAGAAIAMMIGSFCFFLQLYFAKQKSFSFSIASIRQSLSLLAVVIMSGACAVGFMLFASREGLFWILAALTVYAAAYLVLGFLFGLIHIPFIKRSREIPN